ncbi:MAG: aspartate carbamoyltransferase catalytic subunit [Legionellales bacterium]|nr:aspartate carbamoyltransferase catalytic subunit [Legionellales bacterium]
MNKSVQYSPRGKLQHLLDIATLKKEDLLDLLERAQFYANNSPTVYYQQLQFDYLANLFFENSTRTRCSFEIAAKKLGAEVINLDIAISSTQKGESLRDTIHNLAAMSINKMVIRHPQNHVLHDLAQQISDNIHLINAGDGHHEHPTQALLDVFTIRQYHQDFSNLKIAIVGDIRHSRVARSTLLALKLLGANHICLIAPDELLPENLAEYGVAVSNDLRSQVKSLDIIMTLRLQHERMNDDIALDINHYHQNYGLNADNLKSIKPTALIMHPGPLNRGVEMSDEIANCSHSVILQQARNGIFARMAVLSIF